MLSHQPPGAKAWVDVPDGLRQPRPRPVGRPLHPDRRRACTGSRCWPGSTTTPRSPTARCARWPPASTSTSELLAGRRHARRTPLPGPPATTPRLPDARRRPGCAPATPSTSPTPAAPDRPSAAELHRRRLRRTDAAVEPGGRGARRARAGARSAPGTSCSRGRPWRRRRRPPGAAPRHPRATSIDRLDYVADLGFDVLYLPPIHPIGRAFRKGPNNAPERRARRPGQPVGDRRGRGRPHRGAPRARHGRRRARPRGRGDGERHRDRARPRLPVLARPPLGHRAPRVVPPPARRHDPVRREPAEEVPGHLPARLRERRLARRCGRRCSTSFAFWIDAGRPRLPGRQPAHQAVPVLGVAASTEVHAPPSRRRSSSPRRSPGPR